MTKQGRKVDWLQVGGMCPVQNIFSGRGREETDVLTQEEISSLP